MRTIQSEFIRTGLGQEPKKNSPPKQMKKVKEKFSQRELEELMGMHRDIYTRRNGAIRRK